MAAEQTDWWVPAIRRSGKPLYVEIADAIAEDRLSGRLTALQRLPPQRWLAKRLGVNFSTVFRAYIEAQRRGLITAHIGQGSFVSPARAGHDPAADRPSGDLSMNLPPEPDDPALVERLALSFARLGQSHDPRALLRYGDFMGAAADRAAAVRWLAPRLPKLAPQDILLAAGAQAALLAVLSSLAAGGQAVCCDRLCYPGLKSLAAQLGLRLIGLPADDDGPDPASLAFACRDFAPKALCLTPTLHNPTTRTISERRRRQLLEVAQSHGLPIIEDDAYGALPDAPPPPLAALAPGAVFHIAGLAKSLSGGLRLAYVTAPDSRWLSRITTAARATTLMASPLAAALASDWIESGLAQDLLGAVRAESRARQGIAAACLPAGLSEADPQGFHLWLRLPPPWTRTDFLASLRSQGIGVMAADAFTVPGEPPPEAARLSLGGPIGRDHLAQVLRSIAATLHQPPAPAGI
ncbi:2-aminoadipate transaminase [mine drainage metagenome]|uniref:2-aminoadipate transaminase n=1 Tax=mine drainage metagenome TaxID=410659 RepID=A0A1J5SPK6_9ZZZZ